MTQHPTPTPRGPQNGTSGGSARKKPGKVRPLVLRLRGGKPMRARPETLKRWEREADEHAELKQQPPTGVHRALKQRRARRARRVRAMERARLVQAQAAERKAEMARSLARLIRAGEAK